MLVDGVINIGENVNGSGKNLTDPADSENRLSQSGGRDKPDPVPNEQSSDQKIDTGPGFRLGFLALSTILYKKHQ